MYKRQGWCISEAGYGESGVPYEGKAMEREALILSGISGKRLDQLLRDLKALPAGNIELKAVVTPHNKSWKVGDLFAELEMCIRDRAIYHTNVCEERGTKEHDLLIEFHDYILIAEVKASKVREPFFNPQKAYTRITDHFHSDSGIGGAYAQAITLKKFRCV